MNISIQLVLPIEVLNQIFEPLSYIERLKLMYVYAEQKELLVTSSFGTNSAFLLHLIHQVRPEQVIHFINTGYMFKETLAYKEDLTKLWNLQIIEANPRLKEHELTKKTALWKKDSNACCHINKVTPLEPIIEQHKIWISGLMAFQTPHRSTLNIFEQEKNIIKFYPFIDITKSEFLGHVLYHKLPQHPLKELGYNSVGCTHCTTQGKGRSGRWANQTKTECGLHKNHGKKP